MRGSAPSANQRRTDEASRPDWANYLPGHPASFVRFVRTVGSPQIRNRGTVGGSLAHADPAADYPAAIIALGAEMVAEGPKGKRTIKADDFFKGLLTTALAEDEILTEVRVPALAAKTGAAYMKFPHPASRFAVVGVALFVIVTIHNSQITNHKS